MIPTRRAHHRPRPRRGRRPPRPPRTGRRTRPRPGLHQPRRHPRPQRPLSSASFARVWQRALSAAGLDLAGPDQQRPRFHDLRHTHTVWLLAQQVPIGVVAKRPGHANPVVTMRMYQHVATVIHEGQLTTSHLGLTTHHRPR